LPNSTGSETGALLAEVLEAARRRQGLVIRGAGSKSFYGRRTSGRVLEMRGHTGVIAYEPGEMVITARSGTSLAETEALLAAHGQRLAFEPPDFGQGGTIGGMVATGLSGPARPFAGAVRDSVLGARIMDGHGRILRFGGQVFKNVAGFDGFRLMAGAMGSLGILLDLSLRVSPIPPVERAVALEGPWSTARARLDTLLGLPLALSGAMHDGERLHLRLSGSERAVATAATRIGGEEAPLSLWQDLRHHRLPLFAAARLWRLSIPRTAEVEGLTGPRLIDWAGGQIWIDAAEPAEAVRAAARAAGGAATLFHGAVDGENAFEPLPTALMALHRRLKLALDPAWVFNRGRLYEGL
jgi:glycolate oxidase FAD binding subunit